MKALVIKKMLAALCAFSVVGSSVSVVGAIRDNNSNVVNFVSDCDTQIEGLQQKKNDVIKGRDDKLRELDAAINSDRRKLKSADSLIRGGHSEFTNKRNRLARYIKINENEKIRVFKACVREIDEIDRNIEELKKQKAEFEKKLSNQAVFDNIMKEFQNSVKHEPKIQLFQDWEKLRKIDSNNSNIGKVNGNIFQKVDANIQNDIFSSFGPNVSENNNINNNKHPEGDIFASFGPANNIDLFGSIVNFPAASQNNNNLGNDEESNKVKDSTTNSLFDSIMKIKVSSDEKNNNLTNPKTIPQQFSNALGLNKIKETFEKSKKKFDDKIKQLKKKEQQNENIKNSNFYKKEVAELKKQINEGEKCFTELIGQNVSVDEMNRVIGISNRACLAVDRLIWYYNNINLFEGKISKQAQLFKNKFSELKKKYVKVKDWVNSNNLQNSEEYQFISNKIKELDQFNVDDCKSYDTIKAKVDLLNVLENKIDDLKNIFKNELKDILLEGKKTFEEFQKWAESKQISGETSEEYRNIIGLFTVFKLNAATMAFKGKTDKESNDVYKKLVQTGNELLSKMNKFQEEHANNDRKISKRRMANAEIEKEVKRVKITAKEALLGQTQWKNLTGKVEQNHNKINIQYNLLQNMIYNNKRKIAGIRLANEGQKREAARAKKIAAMTSQAQNGFKHLSKRLEQQHIDNDLKEVLKKKEQIKNNQNDNHQNSNISSNKKITLNDFRSLLAGHQHKDNTRIVKGEKVNAWNTCGIFMMTTLKNIYDFMDGKTSKLQGFQNVIDNYEKSGADTSLLYAPIINSTKYPKGKNVGRVFSSNDIKSFLGKNNIGMYKLNIDQIVFINDQTKNPLNVVKPYKDKMIGKVKEFLVSYMKGKNFAPVGVLSGDHWNLLAQYDEANKKVVKLDSLPDEAKWLDIDKAAENCVNVVQETQNRWVVTCELPVFTRGGGFQYKTFANIDSFTLEAQKELIQNIEKMK